MLTYLISGLRLLPGKVMLGGGVALAVFAGVLLALAARGTHAQSGVNGPPDPASLFAWRSPGARPGGVLLQTKPRLAGAERTRAGPHGNPPTERVLSVVRTRPTGPPGTADMGMVAAPQGMPLAVGNLPNAGILNAVPSPFDVPGFGREWPLMPGGGGGIPPSNGPANPVQPGPAVPEPATWAMMIVGIGVVGLALRRRSRLEVTRAAAIPRSGAAAPGAP